MINCIHAGLLIKDRSPSKKVLDEALLQPSRRPLGNVYRLQEEVIKLVAKLLTRDDLIIIEFRRVVPALYVDKRWSAKGQQARPGSERLCGRLAICKVVRDRSAD
jgi:hypothetical protein